MLNHERSIAIFEASKKVIPGGVSSPVRAFKGVGGSPFIVERGEGPYLFDIDGNKYIDYVGSWGPLVLGHADPEVLAKLQEIAARGTSFGCPTELELELCQLICELVPSIEMVRLVNSGTEATMSAIRLARGYTNRPKIIKFDGCYHGHADSLLVKAGSGLATLGVPSSAGVPAEIAQHTLSLPYNNLDVVLECFRAHKGQIAAIIVEPVAGNMGCVPPAEGYLEGLRELCDEQGALLILDEVMTGFRVSLGCAQGLYDIQPDLTTLGKIIGGGLPVGAYGGRRDIMERVSPLGPVYQAGTLSGNPLACGAGLVTLNRLAADPEVFYGRLEELSAKLAEGLVANAQEAGLDVSINRVGSMMTLYFGEHDVIDQETASMGSDAAYAAFFTTMLEHGVYLAPSRYECAFVSIVHSDADIAATLLASKAAFAAVAAL